MNKRDKDILMLLSSHTYAGQRDLAESCGCSLGAVNASVTNLLDEGYLNKSMDLTEKSCTLLRTSAPERAVLLAAGFGLRIPPHNHEKPKALLEVCGETLIERLIAQLHKVGITEIYVVVGFAKEQFEYLIDRYGVELIVNPDYARKNNLHSLALAAEHLNNCYVVPCDIWCRDNPFRKTELYSWYMVSEDETPESAVRINRKQELVAVSPGTKGNHMIGISYLLKDDANLIRKKIDTMVQDRRWKGSFWEEALYDGDRFRILSRVVPSGCVTEINTLEELRRLDTRSPAFYEAAIATITRMMRVERQEVELHSVLKAGPTNCSILFSIRGHRYILRMPQRRTDRPVCYRQEAVVYAALSGFSIADDVLHYDTETGEKISEYLPHARHCDPRDPLDVSRCMTKLRQFHSAHLSVAHKLDLFDAIEHYETLWNGTASVYRDYPQTKANIFSLRTYIDAQEKACCLVHIDAVAENFLISGEDIRLIDWEYAAMQDPHVDIAMFCLHELYDQKQVDSTIRAYFPEGCSDAVRLKIYCYMAVGGLLWSNWCEYKMKYGTEFGAYSLKQYRYAKDYYRIVQHELKKQKEKQHVSS